MFVCVLVLGLLVVPTLQQSQSVAVCQLAKDVGPCDGLVMRYYYNTSSKQCENFYYGGCQGNSNNFKTLMECVIKCQPV